MIKRLKFFQVMIICLAITIAWRPGIADCPDKIGDVLKQIETGDKSGDRQELIRLLRCLWSPVEDLAIDYEKFGSDDIFDRIEEATYLDRLDVIKALVPMMKSKDIIVRGEVAAALAYHKYPASKQWLSEYPDGPDKAVLYAILNHHRSYRWAIDQLDKLDKREDGAEDDLFIEKMAYMNLLYHLAQPASLPFIDGLIESSPEAKIKDRAIKTRARILLLHPDIK